MAAPMKESNGVLTFGNGIVCLMDLPSEVLMEIISHLGIINGDLYRVALVCHDLHRVAVSDSLCQVLARQLFPSETLKLASSLSRAAGSATTGTDVEAATCVSRSASDEASLSQPAAADSPYLTWRSLLMDGNAANGLWVKRIRGAVSSWRSNSSRRFYVNSMRRMAWHASQKKVYLVLDAYGERDLRAAHCTSVYRNDERLQMHSFRYLPSTTRGHQVCVLMYQDSDFCHSPPVQDEDDQTRTTTFRYVYNGGPVRGTDYSTVTFLCMTPKSSLKRIFWNGLHRGPAHAHDGAAQEDGAREEEEEVSFVSGPLAYNRKEGKNHDNNNDSNSNSTIHPLQGRHSSQVNRETREKVGCISNNSNGGSAVATRISDADDVLDWEGVTVPSSILQRRQRGSWGDGITDTHSYFPEGRELWW